MSIHVPILPLLAVNLTTAVLISLSVDLRMRHRHGYPRIDSTCF